MERSREYEDVAVALAEVRPTPRTDFAAELDELVAAGFPRALALRRLTSRSPGRAPARGLITAPALHHRLRRTCRDRDRDGCRREQRLFSRTRGARRNVAPIERRAVEPPVDPSERYSSGHPQVAGIQRRRGEPKLRRASSLGSLSHSIPPMSRSVPIAISNAPPRSACSPIRPTSPTIPPRSSAPSTTLAASSCTRRPPREETPGRTSTC